MRGSGSTSTAANFWSSVFRIATVRAENPHPGASGVPFMNRITGFSEIALWIASRIGVVAESLIGALRGRRLDRQGVDAVADLGSEHVVDELMLCDTAEAGEG